MRQHKVTESMRGKSSRSPLAPGVESLHQRRARRLASFAADRRKAIEALVTGHPRREDLAEAFPGLLFALTTGYGTQARRAAALAAVDAGLPLREASDRLGLPFWLRKLPARAFRTPLSRIPGDPAVVARLVSLIPSSAPACGPWLERVLVAHHAGHADVTLWVARTYRATAPAATSPGFLRTLGWAWFSRTPSTRGAELLDTRWHPEIGTRRAAALAQLWRERIELDVCIGPGIADSWLTAGRCHDYDIVPLVTTDDFLREAKVMDNCLDRFSERLREGGVRVFSIRLGGRPVADLEISASAHEPGMPAITQLRTAHNRRASSELWQVAFTWLGSQPLRKTPPALKLGGSQKERRARLERIWQPFLEALPPEAQRPLGAAAAPASAPAPRRRRSTSR